MQKKILRKKKKKIYRGGFITASIDKLRRISKPSRGGFQIVSTNHITHIGGLEILYRGFKNRLYRTSMSIKSVVREAHLIFLEAVNIYVY